MLTAPEPLDDDDKISFEVSVDKAVIRDNTEANPETLFITIISEDQFFKVLREQIDQAGTKVFGVDLLKLTKRNHDTTDGIPNIVIITTQWIKDHCTDVEGIFRKSGALNQVEELKARIDQGLVTHIESDEDENLVANIIKLFFREMPVPLIPYTHYPKYMEIGSKLAESQIQPQEVLPLLYPNLINLPKPHLKLLIYLLQFLSDMSQYAETTKMDASNLALVFASNIIKSETESIDTSLKFNHVNNLFKLMIEQVNEIIGMLPKDNDRSDSDWLQDVLKYTRSTPIFVEDPTSHQNIVSAKPEPSSPKSPTDPGLSTNDKTRRNSLFSPTKKDKKT